MSFTFLTCFLRKSPTFSGSEQEKAWLIRVTINICKDMLRGRNRKASAEQAGQVVGQYHHGEDSEVLESLLKLPAKYKAVIFLYYYGDYTIAETAKILALSEGNVKTRLSRARGLLKIELERGSEDEQG